MIKIPWDNLPHTNKTKSFTVDIGDMRIILAEHSTHWTLNMGIRVYTKDHLQSKVRPPINVASFDKPCTFEEAKKLTEKYLNEFLSSITSAIEIGGK